MTVQPADRRVHHLVARPLDRSKVQMFELLHVELIVVGAEALIEPPASVEHEGTDERARLVPVARECLGQRGV